MWNFFKKSSKLNSIGPTIIFQSLKKDFFYGNTKVHTPTLARDRNAPPSLQLLVIGPSTDNSSYCSDSLYGLC